MGVDNIDGVAATAAGILVVNAPDANTISAAEHTMALLLAQARRIPSAHMTLTTGLWERGSFKGVELHDKTLVIVGLGKIGKQVAQRANAFGMTVVGYDPYVDKDWAPRNGVHLEDDLHTALRSGDFITLHVPITNETRGMIDADALEATKPGARIVNVSRGGVVDEAALAAALAAGHVAGAAVDVFEGEPSSDGAEFENPLLGLENVVLTPHLGASTAEAQDKAGISIAKAVSAALAGELVPEAVNLEFEFKEVDEARPFLDLAEQLGVVFTTHARGLPELLTVVASGSIGSERVESFGYAALIGSLRAVTDQLVNYVNVTDLAEDHGMEVGVGSTERARDYESVLRLRGTVNGVDRVVAGTVMTRKGNVLTEVDGYQIEFPLTEHMLIVRNDDVPGVIGRVGTLLGDNGVNIADMAVGRNEDGSAMMGLSLDGPLPAHVVDELLELPGVAAARAINLS